jgi:alpha-ketoglutarate-dependent taurine dioxygenase
VISSIKQKKGAVKVVDPVTEPSKFAANGWHADITFEPVPSDYAILKIHTLPSTGGDTVSFLFIRTIQVSLYRR